MIQEITIILSVAVIVLIGLSTATVLRSELSDQPTDMHADDQDIQRT